MRQTAHDQLEALDVHRFRLGGIVAVDRRFDLRCAAAEADVEATAAHLIEHAYLFDQADRMIKRQGVNQRAEAQALGALRHRGEKNAGRRRHTERRRVVLSDMVSVKPFTIIHLDQLESRLVIILQG